MKEQRVYAAVLAATTLALAMIYRGAGADRFVWLAMLIAALLLGAVVWIDAVSPLARARFFVCCVLHAGVVLVALSCAAIFARVPRPIAGSMAVIASAGLLVSYQVYSRLRHHRRVSALAGYYQDPQRPREGRRD